MKNYRLLIQYDGTKYAGWQRQPYGPTIQKLIEDAVQTITKEKINLIGSGRTDSGVHALGQVANFHIGNDINIRKFQHSLNSILPEEISIVKVNEADKDFHSRFDAKKRSYLYIIGSAKSPFYKNFIYNFPPIEKMSIPKLNEVSNQFIGENDFTSFSKKNSDTKNKMCNISLCRWRRNNSFYFFRIDGNRFLHGMVRSIVGSILEIAENDQPSLRIQEIFKLKDRNHAGRAVPSSGLFLYKVTY